MKIGSETNLFCFDIDNRLNHTIDRKNGNNNWGPFTNYIYKRRGVDGQKNKLFVNHYTVENVNEGG